MSFLENRTRSFDYTRDVLQKLERQVRDELARLGGNAGLEVIVNALSKTE